MKKKINKPKKPLLFYYAIAILILMALNMIILPKLSEQQLVEVDYGSFLKMVEDGQVESVQIDVDRIVFTSNAGADKSVYYTGRVLDLDLTNRLLESNVEFRQIIKEEMSPLVGLLLGWIIPIVFL